MPTSIGTNSAVKPALTFPVTLTGMSSVGPATKEKTFYHYVKKVIRLLISSKCEKNSSNRINVDRKSIPTGV